VILTAPKNLPRIGKGHIYPQILIFYPYYHNPYKSCPNYLVLLLK
jgi:hypothetical protein